MSRFKGSLVVGGTGMLAGATRWLAERSATTVLVARRASSFAGLNGLVAVDADWTTPSFRAEVSAVLDNMAVIDAALLWLHEPRPILPWLLPLAPAARPVLVLGSMDGQPTIPDGSGRITTVRLGSVRTATGRRWLTREEISTAAIAALDDGESRVVGELTPIA